jgi:hypothetical protein
MAGFFKQVKNAGTLLAKVLSRCTAAIFEAQTRLHGTNTWLQCRSQQPIQFPQLPAPGKLKVNGIGREVIHTERPFGVAWFC